MKAQFIRHRRGVTFQKSYEDSLHSKNFLAYCLTAVEPFMDLENNSPLRVQNPILKKVCEISVSVVIANRTTPHDSTAP